jgi:sulfofructose kinase
MSHAAPSRAFDVLGLGIVTVDELLYVEHYPAPDTKTRVRHRLRECGGLTGNALIAAARLGARCAYAGRLGDDDASRFVRDALAGEGIDVDAVDPHRTGAPIRSTIVVDESSGSRTILFELPEGEPYGGDWPPESLIASARVLFLDHHDADRTLRAASLARRAGVPTVADLERSEGPRFAELLAASDHLIVGRPFAGTLAGSDEIGAIFEHLHVGDRTVTVVTEGAHGCYFAEVPGTPPAHLPAFDVAAVDTTACGDIYHGAYAAALAWGWALADRLRFAAAAAALQATRPGASGAAPRRGEVDAFLAQHPEDRGG